MSMSEGVWRGGGDGAAVGGAPQSQAMSRATAVWYQEYTKGALVAFQHGDGNWYLYAPTPPAGADEAGS